MSPEGLGRRLVRWPDRAEPGTGRQPNSDGPKKFPGRRKSFPGKGLRQAAKLAGQKVLTDGLADGMLAAPKGEQ